MMVNLNDFLNWNPDGQLEQWMNQARPIPPTFIISLMGVMVELYRPGTDTTLPPQKLVIAPAGQNTAAQQMRGDTGVTAKEDLLLLGAADLDVQPQDRFAYQSPNGRHNYRVVRVEKVVPGQTQAFVEHLS